MRGRTVILTHEHADFDALASLLGAALLFPQAAPVLPWKIQRNVRAFLSRYTDRFPFIEPRRLPHGRVNQAVLVDTRTFNAVKGMDDETGFLVIDHHAASDPLPAGWSLWQESLGPHTTGANVTLLVERIMQRKLGLSSLQATLLALGIYEDTGSLLYPSTTHRDIRCAGWLVEQGARLDAVRRFIHYPPTPAQQILTKRLTEAAEHLSVAGQNIVLAVADAPDFADDLGGLAQRLLELFDPDALFVVVDLGGSLQIVARSGSDAVDVGRICQTLGGGGHKRAAAAHLACSSPAWAREQILDLLQQRSRAPATVSQIMSRGQPRTLDQEMPVAAAMDMMQRYGHEGFPVLQKSSDSPARLVGILTRREADRTLSHRLGTLPVHKVMRQGNYTIGADAPVSELHRIMIDSGWGQIPVVGAAGELAGIVTRTDLLKLWGREGEASLQIPDVSRELEQTLSRAQHRLLWMAGETAAATEQTVYLVGGFVRDLLLGRVEHRAGAGSLDMDLVVEGDAIHLAEQMKARCGGRVVTHARFGTAKWILDEPDHPLTCEDMLPARKDAAQNCLPSHLDFVTARTEFYTEPTVLPTVEQGSIKLDLHRRDFTINTLAIALTPDRWGDLLDFYGGLPDLRTGLVRVLHSLSFVDDPTRILRAVRYEQRFNFRIDARTAEHLLDAAPLLERVTAARLRHELERIFQEFAPEEAIRRLDDLGVLRKIHPELQAGAEFARCCADLRARLAPKPLPEDGKGQDGKGQVGKGQGGGHWASAPAQPDEGWSFLDDDRQGAHFPAAHAHVERLYLGLLVYDLLPCGWQAGAGPTVVEEALSERLKLRNETRKLLRQLQEMKARLPDLLDPRALPSAIVAILEPVQPDVLLLLSVREQDSLLRRRLRWYARHWRHVRPSLDGKDLRKQGLPPGPLYGEILRALRTALLDGKIEKGTAELELAQTLIHEKLAPARSARPL